MVANLVQLVGGPEDRALAPSQDKIHHDAQLVCLAAVLPLAYSFKDSTCTYIAPSQEKKSLRFSAIITGASKGGSPKLHLLNSLYEITQPLQEMVLATVDAAHDQVQIGYSDIAVVKRLGKKLHMDCEAAALFASRS